jgi:hypothetical protein
MASVVRLYLRVKAADGKRQSLEAVFAANGKVKPGYALLQGQPVQFMVGFTTCATSKRTSAFGSPWRLIRRRICMDFFSAGRH